jgi:hypothetical protein
VKTIWKFPLESVDEQTVEMPEGAWILTVQMQGSVPCLWAVVHPEARLTPRRILIHGTGRPPLDRLGRYIGTVQMLDGSRVFHVFEAEQPAPPQAEDQPK